MGNNKHNYKCDRNYKKGVIGAMGVYIRYSSALGEKASLGKCCLSCIRKEQI